MTQVIPRNRAREYETIFILHPDSKTDVVDHVAARCQDVLTKLDGKLLKAENWGRRRLAYPVRKNAKGIYIYLNYLGYSALVHELERNLRVMDSVIKFLTVKVDQDVDPSVRPVAEGDISFVARFDDLDTESRASASVDGASIAPDAGYDDDAVDDTGSKDDIDDDAEADDDSDSDDK